MSKWQVDPSVAYRFSLAGLAGRSAYKGLRDVNE